MNNVEFTASTVMQLRFLAQIKIESSINVNQNQKFCIQEFKLFQLAIYQKKTIKTNTKTYFFPSRCTETNTFAAALGG